jgi:hypothetical protein
MDGSYGNIVRDNVIHDTSSISAGNAIDVR